MNAAVERLLADALGLPDDDRMELVEALIVSIHSPDSPPFDESWREVVARRSEELTSGRVAPIPWSEVKRQGRELSGG
jgi:putative addiction module component (TIGR02574 family)